MVARGKQESINRGLQLSFQKPFYMFIADVSQRYESIVTNHSQEDNERKIISKDIFTKERDKILVGSRDRA